MSKRKIVFIVDTLEVGGAEKSLLAISRMLMTFEPVFIQLFPGGGLHQDFISAKIQIIEMGFRPSYRFKRMAEQTAEVVKKINPCIIHSTLFRADIVSRIIATQLEIPLVSSLVNNSYGKRRYSSLSLLGRLKLKSVQTWDRYTAKTVDLFISNSRTIKYSNMNALDIDGDKVRVIYRGREPKDFERVTPDEISTLRESLHLNDRKVYLNVSRLLNRKGQIDLVKAFAELLKSKNNCQLLIAGEGTFRDELQAEISALGMDNHITILGSRNDIPTLLKVADFFVFPSHYEGLPGALIEAMMSKIPIIASDIPENLECVSSDSSMIFPVRDINALTKAMAKAQEIDWNHKISRAYEFACNNFDIYKITENYELAYQELLSKK